MQVFADGKGHSRLVWIADGLPGDLAGPIGSLVEQDAEVMNQTDEQRAGQPQPHLAAL
jgi:hypothetical protein